MSHRQLVIVTVNVTCLMSMTHSATSLMLLLDCVCWMLLLDCVNQFCDVTEISLFPPKRNPKIQFSLPKNPKNNTKTGGLYLGAGFIKHRYIFQFAQRFIPF